MNSTSIYRSLMAALLILVATGCQQPRSNTLKVGALIPLSNEFAASGGHIRRGIEQATRELHARNRSVEVFYEDACKPKDAITALHRLMRIKKITALVSNFCVIALPAMQELRRRERLITIQTSVAPREFFTANSLIFSSFPGASVEAERLAQHARRRPGGTRAAIVQLETPWGADYASSFEAHFKALGGTVVARELKAIGDNDFKAELARIKAKRPDVLLLVHFGDSLAALLKQAKELHLTRQLLTVQDAYDEKLLKAAGTAADGLTFFLPGVPASLAPAPDKAVHPLTQHAYANTLALVDAHYRCDADQSCILKELKAAFGSTADHSHSLNMVSVKNGRFKVS